MPVSASAILSLLPAGALFSRIRVEEELTSTNTVLKQLAAAGEPEGSVLIARSQTAGRGRMGRTFLSGRDKGLYLSALIRPQTEPERLLSLTGLTAVAAARAAETVGARNVQLKWVNDVLLSRRKLGGILTEPGFSGDTVWAVIGIGLNVSSSRAELDEALGPMATSFYEEGVPADGNRLAAALLLELERMYAAFSSGDTAAYVNEYRARCVTLGEPVKIMYPGAPVEGVALDVDDRFGIRVQTGSGSVTIRSGEVSVRGMYGYV